MCPVLTTVMPFLVGLVHTAAWSILVVAAPRPRKIGRKEWESKRNILAEVRKHEFFMAPSGDRVKWLCLV